MVLHRLRVLLVRALKIQLGAFTLDSCGKLFHMKALEKLLVVSLLLALLYSRK